MAETIVNAAVFINGRRQYRNVDVEYTDESIRVLNRNNHAELASFPVVELAATGQAWDVSYNDGIVRLIAQVGCGCSGAKRYSHDEGYSGRLDIAGRPTS